MTAQIAELKAAQLRQTLIDPAVNLVIQKLTKECDQQKKAAEEAQNELAAWKFTPDSATGKRLMAKCRQLYQENEDLGKMIASGRLAKLEGELALQKNLTEEMKKNQLEMDEFMAELDEDVEGMQSTIYYLQQQLREAKETIARLEAQNGKVEGEEELGEGADQNNGEAEEEERVDEDVGENTSAPEAQDRTKGPGEGGEEVRTSGADNVDAEESEGVDDLLGGKAGGRRGGRSPATSSPGRRARPGSSSPAPPAEQPSPAPGGLSPAGKRGRGRGRGRPASRTGKDGDGEAIKEKEDEIGGEEEVQGRKGKRKKPGSKSSSSSKRRRDADSEEEIEEEMYKE